MNVRLEEVQGVMRLHDKKAYFRDFVSQRRENFELTPKDEYGFSGMGVWAQGNGRDGKFAKTQGRRK